MLNEKHVFCEKAITVNAGQLEECCAIAKERNLVICDGTTILHMPLYKKLREIIDSGKLGKVKMVQVNFGSCKEYDVNNRFFSQKLAGGALLDIGVYAVSFARFFMKSRANVILTTANYFETGVDETSGIILKNPDDEMAVIALTMRAKQPKRGVVACENGYIEINDYPRAASATITYTVDNKKEDIRLGGVQITTLHIGGAFTSNVAIKNSLLSRIQGITNIYTKSDSNAMNSINMQTMEITY